MSEKNTPKAQSVCKHCQQAIRLDGVIGWLHEPDTFRFPCPGRVAEPASTGEPERNEDYWIAACLHIIVCQRQACVTCGTIIAEIDKEHPDVKAI